MKRGIRDGVICRFIFLLLPFSFIGREEEGCFSFGRSGIFAKVSRRSDYTSYWIDQDLLGWEGELRLKMRGLQGRVHRPWGSF